MAIRHLSSSLLSLPFLSGVASGQLPRPAATPGGPPAAVAPSNQFQEASELLAQGSNNAKAWLELGFSYYRQSAYNEALISIRKAVSLQPTNYEGNLWLGFTYYHLSDFHDAVEALSAAAKCKPNEPEVQYWLGNALCFLRHYPEAVASFRKSLALKADQPRVWFALGGCQFRQNSYEGAYESFHQCTLIEPTNYLANIWLAYSLIKLDQVDRAASAFARAVSLRPQDYDANLGHGVTLLRLFRFQEATSSLERALESKPGDRVVRLGLFIGYLATGQFSKVSGLRLGILSSVPIILIILYFPALALIVRKSFRLDSHSSPGIGLALGWCGLTMLGQTVIILVLSLSISRPPSQCIGPAVCLSAMPLICAALFGFARQPWGGPFVSPTHVSGSRNFLTAFVALGGVVLFESGYSWLVERVTGKPMPDQMVISLLSAGPHSRWIAFLGIALFAPAAEEILFRGLLFGAIRRRVSGNWTIFLTAALFAFAHLQFIYFLPLFAMGLVLGWARDRSCGVAQPLILHCLNNGCGLFLAILQSKI